MARSNTRRIGMEKEGLAAEFLEKKGFRILERNFYCRQGEIDLIAESLEGVLVFVEVKYKKNGKNGLPEEAVNRAKQLKIRKAAQYYLYRHPWKAELECRFDVVSILGKEICLIENAFGGW